MNKLILYIKLYLQLLFKTAIEWFFDRGRKLSFTRAKRLAKRRFQVDGKTYYILQGERWIFYVINSLELDKLKRIRLFRKDLNVKTLNEICCYKVGQTCPNGNDYLHRIIK